MTAPAPEPTLGEVFWPAYLAEMPTLGIAHSELDNATQRAVQAGAEAVAAHVVNPTAEDFDNAAEILRLADGEHPALYARWYRADVQDATDAKIARLWKSASEADRQFWAQIASERREDRAELENQAARGDRLEGQREDLRADVDALRELLDHETRLAWQSGLAGERARVAGVREHAGLEAL